VALEMKHGHGQHHVRICYIGEIRCDYRHMMHNRHPTFGVQAQAPRVRQCRALRWRMVGPVHATNATMLNSDSIAAPRQASHKHILSLLCLAIIYYTSSILINYCANS